MHPRERDADDRDSEQDGRDQMAERKPPPCQHEPDDIAEQSEWPGADVVVAEMLAAEKGIGYMIAFYGNTFKVANVFVALGLVAVAGVIFDQIFLLLEKRVLHWRSQVS